MNNNTYNNGENVLSSNLSSDSKKQQKRPRVPKRGPGVAELEKILRERESINISDIRDPQEIGAIHNDYANARLRNLSSENSAPTMIGMKRSHSSTLENSLIPPSNFHVLPSFSNYNRLQQSSINDSHGVSTFNSTNECYRDVNWGRTLEVGNTRCNSDIVVPGHANFPPFATPEVPSPPMHLFPGVLSTGNVLPYLVTEKKMDSYQQHSESSQPDYKPFYNFLEVEDLEEVTDGTNREGGRGVGIDLNLKL